MTVVADASFIIAAYAEADAHHADAAAWGRVNDDELVTTPLALAEMDYLIRRRSGPAGQRTFWADLEAGALTVRWWASGLPETLALVQDRPALGLADASLVALARMLRTDRVATFDAHFDSFDLTLLPERT